MIVFIIVDYVKEQEMQFVRQPFPESDSRKVSWRRTRKPSTNYNFVLYEGSSPYLWLPSIISGNILKRLKTLNEWVKIVLSKMWRKLEV